MMRRCSYAHRLRHTAASAGLVVAVSLAAIPRAAADEKSLAAKPLPALVPADVGVCIEARGLAAAVRQFRSSAHFERLGEFPPWRRWREKEGRDLVTVSQQIAAVIGVNSDELWEKVVGHQLLLAIWPRTNADGQAGKSDNRKDRAGPPPDVQKLESGQAPGVLLVRAADPEALRKAADAFIKAQDKFDRVSWQPASHGGVEYQLGLRPDKRPPMRLAVVGTTAVLSDHEASFSRVLDLVQAAIAGATGSPGSLAELPAYTAAVKAMPRDAALTLFVNPRTWEPVVRADVAAAPAAEQPQKQLLLQTWQAVEFCWASFELTPRMRLQGAVKYDRKALPAPVEEFLACFSGPSGFVAKVPEGALLAAAARVDADRFITWARKYGDADKQPKSPHDAEVVASLLRLLGPDLGFYLKPDEAGDGAQWLQWAGAVAVRPQMPREREAQQLVQAAFPSLLAGVGRMFSESASSRLAGLITGDGLRTLGDSLRLSRSAISTIALADGRLWAAGSERALADAQAVGGDKSLAKSTRWTNHLGNSVREPSHALYVDCAAWGRLLGRHADSLVATTVRERGVDDATARRGLQQLLSLLRLADTVVVALKIDDGRIAVSLSAAVEPPSSPSSSPGEPAARP